ncbi:50S ribosomal protein L4 [Candidatus Altiarchaeota archaeon]
MIEMKATVYSTAGKAKGKIDLPNVFSTEYRPDLIQRAVVSQQSKGRQRYGVLPVAGLQTSAEYFGQRRHTYRLTMNRGQSRLPREKPGGGGLGRVKRVPQSVGGRRAHPPKSKNHSKSINRKEYLIALNSATAASSNPEIIVSRGHIIDKIPEFPIIVEEKLETLQKAKEATEVLEKLGLGADLERAQKISSKAGRAKSRGQGKREKKSVLIVVEKDKGIKRALKNIPGVDVLEVQELDVNSLAPGTHAGRLTVWTETAVQKLKNESV